MNTGYLYLRDTDNENLSTITFTTTSATKTANITNKYYDSAGIYYQYISEITEIILM